MTQHSSILPEILQVFEGALRVDHVNECALPGLRKAEKGWVYHVSATQQVCDRGVVTKKVFGQH